MCCLVARMCVSVCAFGGPRAEVQRLVVCLRSLAPWDAMQRNGSQALDKRISFSFTWNQLCRSELRFLSINGFCFCFSGTNFGRRACHGQAHMKNKPVTLLGKAIRYNQGRHGAWAFYLMN